MNSEAARRRLLDARQWAAVALATCAGLTFIPALCCPRDSRATGAGIIGSLAGLLTLRWLPAQPLEQALMLVGGCLISVAVSDVAEEALGRTDDPRIVVDEWIGMWITMAFLPRGAAAMVAGFALFRAFDVFKTAPIRRLSRLPGGWGVVMDDVLAGIFANIVLRGVLFVLSR